ncbi:uncharacterized protein LOC111712361 [Eurytemora carolleeae]|uniref:uncharacterized protein LOC111712361 n=1 Tax=Eurytemora carolleeae TaxID=1294199 RepID=UPI000C75B303|nr:uncharacterized protein LOC111712361 [Eurytemora carolleeae]|eukprot:XP_023342712.1 uncharacterized protein LOC111712361 [Eurytemora affinis]
MQFLFSLLCILKLINSSLGFGFSIGSCLTAGQRCTADTPATKLSNQCCQHLNLICIEDPDSPQPKLSAVDSKPSISFDFNSMEGIVSGLNISDQVILSGPQQRRREYAEGYRLGVEALNNRRLVCTAARQ